MTDYKVSNVVFYRIIKGSLPSFWKYVRYQFHMLAVADVNAEMVFGGRAKFYCVL